MKRQPVSLFSFFFFLYFRKKHRPVPQRAPVYVEQSENGHDSECTHLWQRSVGHLEFWSGPNLKKIFFFFFSSFAVDVVPKPSTLGRRSPMPLYVLTEDVSPPSSFSFNKNNTQQWHSVWSPELYKRICYSVTWSLKLFIKNQHPLKTSPQSHRQVFGEKKKLE